MTSYRLNTKQIELSTYAADPQLLMMSPFFTDYVVWLPPKDTRKSAKRNCSAYTGSLRENGVCVRDLQMTNITGPWDRLTRRRSWSNQQRIGGGVS